MKIFIVTLSLLFWLDKTLSDNGKEHALNEDNSKPMVKDPHEAVYAKWGKSLVFEENFDGNILDLDNWEYWEGCDERESTGNLQCYTKENVVVHNGTLIITAKRQKKDGKQYTSGRIRHRGSGFANASFVIRAKLARGDLLWSALRLFSTKHKNRSEEIDLIEYASRAPNLWRRKMGRYYEIHPKKLGGWITASCNETVCSKPDLSADFNEYVLQWSPDQMTWYINENYFFTTYQTEPFLTDPFQLILNLELGKSFFDESSPINVSTWVKPTLEVDWVRVYSNATQPAQNHGVTHTHRAQYKWVVTAFLLTCLQATKS